MKQLCVRLMMSILLAASMVPTWAADGSAASAHAASSAAASAHTATEAAAYEWQNGPAEIALLDQATIKLPAGFAFLEGAQAQQMLQKMGNPNVTDVVGVVTNLDRDWLVVMRFDKVGYVKDGDAKNWNPDTLIESIIHGAEQTNVQRREQKSAELEILGWLEQPRYDPKLHRVTWAIAVRDKNDENPETQGMNHTTYLLGRDGYFTLNLITSLFQIDKNKPHVETLVSALTFKDGKQYTDFNASTDKAAPFGLTALVSNAATGDAKKDTPKKKEKAEPAAKDKDKGGSSGYLKWLIGAAIGLVIGALGAGTWWFLRKRKASKDNDPPELTEKVEPSGEDAAAGADGNAEGNAESNGDTEKQE